jgi:Protein of unknown function
MSEAIPVANPPLTAKEQSAVAKLSDMDLKVVDAEILANSAHHWLNVTRVVLPTVNRLSDRYPDLSYIFYAQRLIHLVAHGRLEAKGDLEQMRFSEVRIPGLESPA